MKIEIKDNSPNPVGVEIHKLDYGTLVYLDEDQDSKFMGIIAFRSEESEADIPYQVFKLDGDLWELPYDELVYPVKNKTITVTWEL